MARHLYFHIPFCHHICPYCGFFKHQPGKESISDFVDALGTELERSTVRNPETLYFGGGTPSILSLELWERLGGRLQQLLDFSEVTDWTIEANPRTFSLEKARLWREIGITRVSLGVQALDAATLKTLGRDHSPEEAIEAFQLLREAEIPAVNIDLMFAIPGQTPEIWGAGLDQVVSLEPDHVSAYNLTFEEDTEFLAKFESGNFGWKEDNDRDAGFFTLADEKLGTAGFEHYEVSNYARPGKRSLHNQAYWAGSDYLGLGPSAVSTIQGERWKNVSDTAAYIDQVARFGHAKAEAEKLTEEQRSLERLALGLRTADGIEREPEANEATLIEEGLALRESGRLRLTLEGMMVADEIAGFLA
ncbi:MAG: oxygen-independent coproporphyrinogen-3 oxidase [Verrucomicrobiales bacterium]|jgi:oxygen-independent coproporphyrinogen-3 oxidase